MRGRSGVNCPYEEDGLDGLLDKRLVPAGSHRRAPLDSRCFRLVEHVTRGHDCFLARLKHYSSLVFGGPGSTRSYSWVKNTLQAAGVVKVGDQTRLRIANGASRPPGRGYTCSQDGSEHDWVPDRHWDLTLSRWTPSLTNEHYSMWSSA